MHLLTEAAGNLPSQFGWVCFTAYLLWASTRMTPAEPPVCRAFYLPRLFVYGVATGALSRRPIIFFDALVTAGHSGDWSKVVGLSLVYLLVPLFAAAFFAFNTCDWAVTRGTCRRPDREVRWVVVLATIVAAVVLALNAFASVVIAGCLDVGDGGLPALLRIAQSSVCGPAHAVALALSPLLWIAAIALVFACLARANPDVAWHFHHYGIAFVVTLLLDYDTFVHHLLWAAAYGAFVQGAYVAHVQSMAVPGSDTQPGVIIGRMMAS